jgi:hypothetical protein
MILILGGSAFTINKNTEALLIVSNEIGLEVNVQETKCMVLSREQITGKNSKIKIGNNKSLEWVGEFKYLETTETNKNFIHKN